MTDASGARRTASRFLSPSNEETTIAFGLSRKAKALSDVSVSAVVSGPMHPGQSFQKCADLGYTFLQITWEPIMFERSHDDSYLLLTAPPFCRSLLEEESFGMPTYHIWKVSDIRGPSWGPHNKDYSI